MGHIELARWADLVLIAPATADLMARLAQGVANDLLTTVVLATNAPVALAPAMNQAMWADPLPRPIVSSCWRGIRLFGPGSGSQACGDIGMGRMLEAEELARAAADCFETGMLTGKHLLITAGPTQENIDPVRYITNHSSGRWVSPRRGRCRSRRAGHPGDRPGVPAHSRSCSASTWSVPVTCSRPAKRRCPATSSSPRQPSPITVRKW